jgi:hypothetical protein
VFNILSKRLLQVEKKNAWPLIRLIISPPSALKMRASDRVVTLGPTTSGLVETPALNSLILSIAVSTYLLMTELQ